HILMSTRKLTLEGFTEKTRELDQKHSGEIEHWREHFADICNMHLDLAGYTARVDHRSYKDQANGLEATLHEGPKVTELRRKGDADGIPRSHCAIKTGNPAQVENGQNKDTVSSKNRKQPAPLKTGPPGPIKNWGTTPPTRAETPVRRNPGETLGKVLN